MSNLPSTRRNVQLSKEHTARTLARRNGAVALVSTVALWSFVMMYGPGLGLSVIAPSVGNDTAATATVAAPNAPTATVAVFAPTGDSARVVGSAFVGSGSDTHDSTQIAVDTAGTALDADSGFASPRFFSSLGAVLTDTVPALDSAGVFKARMRYHGATATGDGWSAWSDTVQFTMVSGPTADFSSVFAGSTWTDNGQWEVINGSNHGTYLLVFTTGVDADVPGGRGLRNIGTNGDNFWNEAGIVSGSRPPVPAVGETITWRFYHKIISGDLDGDYHPGGWNNNLGSLPGTDWPILAWTSSGGSWQPQLRFSSGSNGAHSPAENYDLSANVWYRYEYNITRTGTSTWTWDFRVYNPAGTELLNETDLLDNNGSGTALGTKTFTVAQGGEILFLGFGNGLGSISGTHEQDRWAAIVAVTDAAAAVDIPYPITGEN